MCLWIRRSFMPLLFNFLEIVFFNSFAYEFAIESTSSNGKAFSNPKGKRRNIEPPNFTILDS